MSNVDDFEIQDGVLIKYNGKEKDVIIPDGATSIGDRAFFGANCLESVIIPNGVKSIGDVAFGYCSKLKSIKIPESVSKIGGSAFSCCSSLSSIDIPFGVTDIRHGTFRGCTKLSDVKLPDSVTSIEHFAFKECESLENISIPDSVTVMGNEVFSGCKNLTSIVVPEGVPYIGDEVFYGCKKLNSVTLPDSVTDIGDWAFSLCFNLTSIIIPDNVTNIGDDTTSGKKYGWYIFDEDTVVILKEYIKGIEKKNVSTRLVFKETPIKEIKSANAKTLAVNGFLTVEDLSVYNDDVIEGYKKYLKGKVDKFADFILKNNSEVILERLSSLGLLDSKLADILLTKDISDKTKAFLESFASKDESNNDQTSEDNSLSIDDLKKIWKYDKNEDGITITSYNGSDSELVIPDAIGQERVTEIGDEAFATTKKGRNQKQKSVLRDITSVTIPDGVTRVGACAFRGCESLRSIILPNSVTSIGHHAFSSLINIYVSDLSSYLDVSFEDISWSAMSIYVDQELVTDLSIPDGVTEIRDNAFYGCCELTSVSIPKSVKQIGYNAFGTCHMLTDVTIAEGTTSIGPFAFYGCNNLKHITLPDSVTSIGACAFSGCSNLQSITLPNHIAHIGKKAFENLQNVYINDFRNYLNLQLEEEIWSNINYYINGELVADLTLQDSIEEIKPYAFSGCSLTSIMIQDSVSDIGEAAFYRCSNLTSVRLPNGLKKINDGTFVQCGSLRSINIPDSVTSIGRHAFSDCSSLQSITIPDSVTSIMPGFINCNNLTIIASSGSYAEQFAKENGISFKPLRQL